MTDFALRNGADLAGFANDVVRCKAELNLPRPRVLFAVRTTAVALFDRLSVEHVWGPWTQAPTEDGAERASSGTLDATLGWDDPRIGMLVLPARWDSNRQRAQVPSLLLHEAGAGATAGACVVVDSYGRPGPAAKEGRLLRGCGTLSSNGTAAVVQLQPERMTSWNGTEVRSESADGT